MGDDSKTLDALRREIDEIDDSIHDLLMQRAAVVERVGAAKRGAAAVFVRPGREALVLRRLIARHQGRFPATAVIHIWREIFAALTALQGPFSVAVHQPEGGPDTRRLARAHFGAATPITRLAHAGHVIAAVSDGSASVGVLPLPEETDTEPWWRYLISDRPDRARIVARLPAVVETDRARDSVGALVVACVAFDDTGDDNSYLDIQSQEQISRARMQTALSDIGLAPLFYSAWRDDEHPVGWHHLVELPGHLDGDNAAIQNLIAEFEPKIDRVDAFGGYPAPLDLSADGEGEDGDGS